LKIVRYENVIIELGLFGDAFLFWLMFIALCFRTTFIHGIPSDRLVLFMESKHVILKKVEMFT